MPIEVKFVKMYIIKIYNRLLQIHHRFLDLIAIIVSSSILKQYLHVKEDQLFL